MATTGNGAAGNGIPGGHGHPGANGVSEHAAPPGADGAAPVTARARPRADLMPPARVVLPGSGADAETVDVVALGRTVGRSWRTVLAGAAVGLLVGTGLVLFFPPSYPGVTTVLVRNANDPTGSLLSRFGLGGDVGGAAGGALGSVLKSPLETELQLLGSRDVLGHVVDSLGLQARVRAPRGVPSAALVAPARYPGSFRRRTVGFTRQADGTYRADGAAAGARPGGTVVLPVVGPVRLAAGPLPPSFRIQFEDREDATTRLEGQIAIEKKGGEVVEVGYAGPDSLTAAAVPNAVVATYLDRRRTVDRGLNQRRFEFLSAQVDSVAAQLASAEGALRARQEASGVFDPEQTGQAALDAFKVVREQSSAVEAERRALRALVTQVEQGGVTPRQLAAFPSLLRSPAVNSILSQISALETERTRLLERRTERDPEVVAISQSVRDLEQSLLPLGRTYAEGLERQAADLARQQGEVDASLARLPGQAEGNLRAQRDVKRLTQTSLGLQAQLIDARLASIGEGGQVRAVDAATAPKKRRFPRPLPTLVVSLILGLFGGAAWAVVRGALSRRVATPADAERATGLPGLVLGAHGPLLFGGAVGRGTVLVLPVGSAGAADAVARALAADAVALGHDVALVELGTLPADAGAARAAARAVAEAEAAHAPVVVSAPGLDDRRVAGALDTERATVLAGARGRVTRAELADAATALARLGVPCLGVVLVEPGAAGRARPGSARGRAGASAVTQQG